MRVAAVQMCSTPDKDRNLALAAALITGAVDAGASFVALPELFNCWGSARELREAAEPHLKRIDLLLLMTVNPGFGGQPFIAECLPKIQHAARLRARRDLHYRIEVDGGINDSTAAECAKSGADTFVAGNAVFAASDPAAEIAALRAQCAQTA